MSMAELAKTSTLQGPHAGCDAKGDYRAEAAGFGSGSLIPVLCLILLFGGRILLFIGVWLVVYNVRGF